MSNPWRPGWYGFDSDSEMCEAWGAYETQAHANSHPELDPSEHGEIKTFLILDATQVRQLLAEGLYGALHKLLEGVDALPASTPTGDTPSCTLETFIQATAENAGDADKLTRMALAGPTSPDVSFTFQGDCTDADYTARMKASGAAPSRGLTSAEIAARWEHTTAHRVHLTGLHLGIRLTYGLYSPADVDLIERELLSRGCVRASATVSHSGLRPRED